MLRAIIFVICVLLSAPAFAQSTYMAATVGADVFRSDHIDGSGIDFSTSGEAVAVSLRVGTAITDRWGVELEFTRPAEITRQQDHGFPVSLLARNTLPAGIGIPSSIEIAPTNPGLAPSILAPRIRLERRNLTWNAAAWVVQPITDRADLVYLGGVVFSRVTEEREFDFARAAPSPIVVFPSTRAVSYGVGPVVGVEARMRLTEHVMLVPGIRLHGIDDNAGLGWLFRPAVGLGWRF